MKSYNHLWEKFLTEENCRKAIEKASKGKRHKKYVKPVFENMEEYIPRLMKLAGDFKSEQHTPKIIYDGIQRKQRSIIVPYFHEQVIHHMVMNVLIPIMRKGMYEHSYASMPDRGVHKGKKVIEKWIRKDSRNVKYCLKLDIRKYFESVDTTILKSMFHKVVRDENFLAVLDTVIDSVDNGLPLGFYTSQWFANYYLTGFDHFVKEQLKAKYYIRYMDDIVIFGSSKRKLHKLFNSIKYYLKSMLNLEVKSNWQIFRFSYIKNGMNIGRDLDFMGFRFYGNRTTMRRSIMIKATRKARHIKKKGAPNIYDARQMLSYLGWLKCTDTYGMYLKHIKPYVNFKSIRNKVSRHDRRKNYVEKITVQR